MSFVRTAEDVELAAVAEAGKSALPWRRRASALLGGGLMLCATTLLPTAPRAVLPRRLTATNATTELTLLGRAALEEQLSSKQGTYSTMRKEIKELLGERMRRDSLVMANPEVSWEGSGWCGIATNMLDNNQNGMHTFCDMGLQFWWNWAPDTRMQYQAPCARSSFIPMIWGYSPDNSKLAHQVGQEWGMLMGYNEPDLYGPPPVPGGDYLSSGTFAPTFHCGSPDLAHNWQSIVMAFKQANPLGIIVSPAMADASTTASTGDDTEQCNASPQMPDNHMIFCAGWMKCFKENVKQLSCGDTNCWDAINVLQFHAYEYHAENLISKVQRWESIWAADLDGVNGHSRKTLWLTEFAHAGTTDSFDPTGEARQFLEQSVLYLNSSKHVSGWSWFSQEDWASFAIDTIEPASPTWSSALIDSFGAETPLGQTYSTLCRDVRSMPPMGP